MYLCSVHITKLQCSFYGAVVQRPHNAEMKHDFLTVECRVNTLMAASQCYTGTGVPCVKRTSAAHGAPTASYLS